VGGVLDVLVPRVAKQGQGDRDEQAHDRGGQHQPLGANPPHLGADRSRFHRLADLGRLQPSEALLGDVEGLVERKTVLPGEAIAQGFPLNVLHGIVVVSTLLPDKMDGHHVGMGDLGGGGRLATKTADNVLMAGSSSIPRPHLGCRWQRMVNNTPLWGIVHRLQDLVVLVRNWANSLVVGAIFAYRLGEKAVAAGPGQHGGALFVQPRSRPNSLQAFRNRNR